MTEDQTGMLKKCKFCNEIEENITIDMLQCVQCNQYIHSKCLHRGSVPGSLVGDIFYEYTCVECSTDSKEHFVRNRMSWLQVVVLVLYHLKSRKFTLSRKGYFHWKLHIVAYIDQNWDILFKKDLKRKKQWMGTISGALSNYSPVFFVSGTTLLNEPGWWALRYPNLPPSIIIEINEEMTLEKQKCKELKIPFDSLEKVNDILKSKPYAKIATTTPNNYMMDSADETFDVLESKHELRLNVSPTYRKMKRKINLDKESLLPTIENILIKSKGMNIIEEDYDIPSSNVFKKLNIGPFPSILTNANNTVNEIDAKLPDLQDYLCHYDTSLESTNQLQSSTHIRLIGSIRQDFIVSPYSSICLSPFIWRSISIHPPWLQLMDEVKYKVNCITCNWTLEPRASLDFTYVQPNHIPALNSLCSRFFWPGINLTGTLQYPEYTCIVLYQKLIIGFACVVPNTKVAEIYLSFIFTMPGWRKCGIAKFMLYHITQVSGGKNVSLHVPTTNLALLLFQKYGFKIQYLEKNFYDKYLPKDSLECRDAFFCKLIQF